jgi:four helix bundle protein
MGRHKPFGERCLQFGVAVLSFIGRLSASERQTPRILQLEKSATSIGANVAESKSAQSRADFISKFEIALKEAREADYWLRLMKASQLA